MMAFAVIGGLAPDLDAAESKIKHLKIAGIKPFIPLAVVIHRDFGHRRLWHSLYGWGLWTIIIMPLSLEISWLPIAALSLGYAGHLVGDAGTKSGIPLLYPKSNKWHLFAKKFRIATGSYNEEVVFVLFSLLVMNLLIDNMKL